VSLPPPGSKIAVVLAGAVAKGAFEAGALRVLARADLQITRIVAASSGALNGAMLAAGVHGGDQVAYVDKLVDLWREHGGWRDAFHFEVADLLSLRGVSDQSGLFKLTRDHITAAPRRAPVFLDVIVAPLRGVVESIDGDAATTYEQKMSFDNGHFETDAGLALVFQAVTASASFPGLFAPEDLPGLGPTVDGGVVNNTPIHHAIDADVDAIVVIAPTMKRGPEMPAEPRGVGLAAQLAEMLVNERLYRDLRGAESVNKRLAALDALVASGTLTPDALDAVKEAIGWTARRRIGIVEIRPKSPLPGNAFSGFRDRDTRDAYLRAGEDCARQVLGL